mgnify:CR=1 FL=1
MRFVPSSLGSSGRGRTQSPGRGCNLWAYLRSRSFRALRRISLRVGVMRTPAALASNGPLASAGSSHDRLMALRTGVDRVRSESVHLTHGTVGVQKSAETRPKLSSEECRVRAAVGVAARAQSESLYGLSVGVSTVILKINANT